METTTVSTTEMLVEQLRKPNATISSVELDATCSNETLQHILDAILNRSSENEDIQIFSIIDITLESETFSKVCEALVSLKQLRELTLASIGLSANALRKLCKILNHFQHLSLLSLAGNRKLGSRGIKMLSENYLAKNKTLVHLDLSDTSMGHFGAQSLSLPTTLQTLLLKSNAMGHDGIWKLAEPLQRLDLLHTLNLASNNCLDDGCLEIAKHISFWHHLRHLNLANNDIGDIGVEVLAREMDGSLVREVYLQNNQITDAGAAHLGDRLLGMTNLQVLQLANNKIQNSGCISIAHGLVYKEDVSEDDEDGDGSEEEDLTELGDAVNDDEDDVGSRSPLRNGIDAKDTPKHTKQQTRLKILNLSCNQIGDGGAGAFVELLDEIPSLRVLDTTSNQVSEARARILDVLLKHRQHDQQRMVESTKSRPTIILSPTPPRPLRQTSAFESISFDLTEAEAEDDEAGNDLILNDEKALLKNVLEQPMDASGGPAINLSHAYFNLLTSNFSPKRIITYSSVGNIYDAHDDELDGATLMVRSLYMHTAGAMNEVRASVVGELKHIQHDNIMRITAQLLGPSVYCFLYDLRDRKSLRDILENEYARTAFSWNLRVKTMLCIAQALHYVHEGDQSRRKPSFHGDINPSNIFVASDYSVAKLSGCGLSRLIATDRGRFHSGEAVFGSRGYRCPRYERGSCQYDAASDMFSFGVIAAELLTGCLQGTRKNPNGMSNDVLFDNLFGENPFEADLKPRPVAHRQVLESIGQIAAACMNLVPSSRPSAAAVIQFIAGIPLLPEPLTNNNA